MAIFNKLVTALRGGVNELGENIVDAQALRILDQEIRDTDTELKQAKEALANILAEHKLAENRIAKMNAKIAEYEGYTINALEIGNEALALEVAEKIASLENELELDKKHANSFADNVKSLQQTIQQTETNIKNLKQQVDIVKATESVQKAQTAVAQRYGGSTAKLQTALDSLERIKSRQEKAAAKMDAQNELNNSSSQDKQLEAKLAAAGIKTNTQSASLVLARIKNKANK